MKSKRTLDGSEDAAESRNSAARRIALYFGPQHFAQAAASLQQVPQVSLQHDWQFLPWSCPLVEAHPVNSPNASNAPDTIIVIFRFILSPFPIYECLPGQQSHQSTSTAKVSPAVRKCKEAFRTGRP